MTGAVVTGSFVMAAVGAFYLLEDAGKGMAVSFSRSASSSGVISSIAHHFSHRRSAWKIRCAPSARSHGGDGRALQDEAGAGIILMGQPNEETGEIDNPLVVNNVLSFLIYGTTKAEVRGSIASRAINGQQRCRCSYYAYHIMAGLGTWFVLIMIGVGISAVARKALHSALGALGAAAQLSAALHRQHGRLDDRGTWASAVAHLRTDAHQRGLLQHRLGRQWTVYADRFHGPVCVAGPAFHGADLSRNQPRPRAHGACPKPWSADDSRTRMINRMSCH